MTSSARHQFHSARSSCPDFSIVVETTPRHSYSLTCSFKDCPTRSVGHGCRIYPHAAISPARLSTGVEIPWSADPHTRHGPFHPLYNAAACEIVCDVMQYRPSTPQVCVARIPMAAEHRLRPDLQTCDGSPAFHP